ncbi:MAG: hypothetical protein SFY67_00640 [Candidatus Melainabacteria bacterium]|nr:hypothetical protein [Candidatus Melainabacteria bacterium]
MEIQKERRGGPKRIGELLVAAGIIRQEVLMEALQIAKKSSTPVGRVLMTIGELSERNLQVAIEVQSMIRDQLISPEFGIRALNQCARTQVPLEETFRRLGWTPPAERTSNTTNELGRLLIDAGIITEMVLEQGLRQSVENDLPLGRCLVLSRVITANFLASALTAQVLFRDGKISYDQAINGLRASAKKAQPIEDSLQESGAYASDKGKVKVGDLLAQAGIVSEADKATAVERGLSEGMPVGEVFVQSGMISPSVLDESLKLQEMVNNGQMSSLQAAAILNQANARNVPMEAVIQEKSNSKDEVAKVNKVIYLVRKAELLNRDEWKKMEILASQMNVTYGEVIYSRDLLPRKLLDAVFQGQKLIEDDLITEGHLVKVLRAVRDTKVEFSVALKTVSPDADDHSHDSRGKQQEEKGSGIFGIFRKK